MDALRIKNTSESYPYSYEATEAVAKKAQKQFWGFNGIRTQDLHDYTVAVQCSTNWAMKPHWKQVKGMQVQFIPVIWRQWQNVYVIIDIDQIFALRIENTNERDPGSYEATKAVANKAQKEIWD